MKILFEDNHLIAVDKEANLPTQVSKEHPIALETKLKEFLKKRDQKPGNVFLQPIHRLDKGVSGIVLFAKTSKALSRMQESMRSQQFQKKYLALVEGVPAKTSEKLIHDLLKKEHKAVIQKSPLSKKAELHYSVVKTKNKKALLEIDLMTGRYHQIRAQLSYIGHPIVGDQKYGSKKSLKEFCLRHVEVSFPHVISKETITIQADKEHLFL